MRICRTVGTGALRNLDPFLMLDELRMPAAQASAGFPSHPHRGFETCSIMFTGKMEHQDSVGNKVRCQLPATVQNTLSALRVHACLRAELWARASAAKSRADVCAQGFAV